MSKSGPSSQEVLESIAKQECRHRQKAPPMIPKLVQKIDVDTRYIREMNASLLLGQYVGQDKPWALLVVSDYGEHLLTPTINLEAYGLSPAPGHAFIKDYSENEGVLASLQNSGIISAPGSYCICWVRHSLRGAPSL